MLPNVESQHNFDISQLIVYLFVLGVLWVLYILARPSPITLYFNDNANNLTINKPCSDLGDLKKRESITLRWIDFLLSKSPSLSGERKYYPTLWLNNPHLQTYYTSLKSYHGTKISYERQLLPMEDGGQVALDWYPSRLEKGAGNVKSIAIMLHGLTGSSQEGYIRETVSILTKDKGLWAIVLNNRGCGGSEILTPRLFNAGDTRDLKAVIFYLHELQPNALKWAVGFSLGANILVKYVGEVGEATPLSGAVSVSNPCDLVHCSSNFSTLYMQRIVYNPVLGAGLVKLLKRHIHLLDEVYTKREWKGVRSYDRDVTRKMYGFQTVNDYYRWASSDQYVTKVKIPLLMFTSTDDPISPELAIPYQECKYNPFVLLATTQSGGHLGWWTGTLQPEYWFPLLIQEYLQALNAVYENTIPAEYLA